MITVFSVIFCPNESYFDRFKTSITSILSADLTDVDKIVIDGWVSSDTIWRKVQELVSDIDNVVLNRRERNIGKSAIINENIPDTPLVVYSDSDIVIFPDTILRLKKLSTFYDIIVPDQLEDCRHYKLVLDRLKIVDCNNEKLYQLLTSEGVAGGFLMMKTNVIKKFKFPNKGPYGSDDVEFFQQTINEHSIVLCLSIAIVHPFDSNKEYYDWKVEMSLSAYKKELTTDDIDNRINSSIKFWNNK